MVMFCRIKLNRCKLKLNIKGVLFKIICSTKDLNVRVVQSDIFIWWFDFCICFGR